MLIAWRIKIRMILISYTQVFDGCSETSHGNWSSNVPHGEVVWGMNRRSLASGKLSSCATLGGPSSD